MRNLLAYFIIIFPLTSERSSSKPFWGHSTNSNMRRPEKNLFLMLGNKVALALWIIQNNNLINHCCFFLLVGPVSSSTSFGSKIKLTLKGINKKLRQHLMRLNI